MAGSTEFKVNITIQAKDKSSPQTKKTASGFDKLTKSVTQMAAAFGALKAAQAAVDFAKFGAGVKRQQTALDGLAKSAGTSGKEIVSAIQGASNFTIDRMTAMEAANKAMMLDVAKSPEVFERLTKVATSLGRAMGQDAATSISDFTVAAGRQSMQIADNLGLTIKASAANALYAKENNKVADSLTTAEKKQAFLNEMLRQGEIKMAEMGNTSLDAAGKFEQIESAVSDMKTGFAEMAIEAVEAAVDVGALATVIRELPSAIKEGQQAFGLTTEEINKIGFSASILGPQLKMMKQGWEQTTDALEKHRAKNEEANRVYIHTTAAFGMNIERHQQYQNALDLTAMAENKAAREVLDLRRDIDNTVSSISYMTKTVDTTVMSQNAMERSIMDVANALEAEKKATEKQAEALLQRKQAMNDTAIAFTDFFRDAESQRKDNAKTIEELEIEHQENLAEITKKGQSRAIRIDEVSEKAKLETLQKRLSLALLQQSEFTEKTKESTRVSKQNQIDTLQSQIGEQTTLLDDYYNGRLVTQGQNITAELAAEQARYDEELRIAKERQAEQEAEQRLSLGRMILQQFEAWATMKGVPAEAMLNMKNQIAEDYGLITEEGKTQSELQIAVWAEWEKDMSRTMEEAAAAIGIVITKTGEMKKSIDDIPTSKRIDIEINVRKTGFGGSMSEMGNETAESAAAAVGPTVESPMFGSGPDFANGANFTVPGAGTGDTFPFRAQSGERVIVIPKEQNTTNNFTLNSSTRATQASVDQNFQMMQEMAA